MLNPSTPTLMWAVQDTILGTYSFPLPTHEETRTGRDSAFKHLPETQRRHLFPVVPVLVTIAPAPESAHPQPQQAQLFSQVPA